MIPLHDFGRSSVSSSTLGAKSPFAAAGIIACCGDEICAKSHRSSRGAHEDLLGYPSNREPDRGMIRAPASQPPCSTADARPSAEQYRAGASQAGQIMRADVPHTIFHMKEYAVDSSMIRSAQNS